MIKEVKLKTLHMFDKEENSDSDYPLWVKIMKYIDGEIAFVIKSSIEKDSYVFLGLKDKLKDKELHYMMEQDSMTGSFIDDREGFEKAWESGDYSKDECFYLDSEYVEEL